MENTKFKNKLRKVLRVLWSELLKVIGFFILLYIFYALMGKDFTIADALIPAIAVVTADGLWCLYNRLNP